MAWRNIRTAEQGGSPHGGRAEPGGGVSTAPCRYVLLLLLVATRCQCWCHCTDVLARYTKSPLVSSTQGYSQRLPPLRLLRTPLPACQGFNTWRQKCFQDPMKTFWRNPISFKMKKCFNIVWKAGGSIESYDNVLNVMDSWTQTL